MVNKKSGIVVAALLTLFSFVTVTYFSCTKTSANLHSCNGVICENGGYCLLDSLTKKPQCICPTGFEGVNCATASVSKYLGTWDVTQTITHSDSTIADTVSSYMVYIKQTATPTTFFIDNFSNNPYYNEILCDLDSTNSSYFTIDTISALHMLFDHYRLLWGTGSISASDSLITASIATKHLTPTTNWVSDSITMVMRPHKN